MMMVSTIPVRISAAIPRWKPSVNSAPRLSTPITAPTVVRLIVLTATTRIPARRTGPASGSSTRKNCDLTENPTAVADWRTPGSTEARPSAVVRTMRAIP